MEQNHFSKFGRESFKKHFYEIIFEIGPLAYEMMSLKSFSIFSSGGHFVQPSITILAHLVEGPSRNISVKII